MGALAITVIVGAGLLIGFGVQYLTHPRTQLDWLFVAIATGLGAYLGSDVLTKNVFGLMVGGPEIDGLLIIPAVITGLVLGLLADAFVRYIALEPG
ncbi:MAG TPA: hypothetical protein VIN69_07150 [Candidatus Limnocylindria bacterium]|jgi:hypothetical protein